MAYWELIVGVPRPPEKLPYPTYPIFCPIRIRFLAGLPTPQYKNPRNFRVFCDSSSVSPSPLSVLTDRRNRLFQHRLRHITSIWCTNLAREVRWFVPTADAAGAS